MSVAHTGTDYIVSPGEVLEEFLQSRNLDTQDFAARCGLPTAFIHDLIAGKASLTEQAAIQFGRVLETDAQIWSNLESNYRLKLTQRDGTATQ